MWFERMRENLERSCKNAHSFTVTCTSFFVPFIDKNAFTRWIFIRKRMFNQWDWGIISSATLSWSEIPTAIGQPAKIREIWGKFWPLTYRAYAEKGRISRRFFFLNMNFPRHKKSRTSETSLSLYICYFIIWTNHVDNLKTTGFPCEFSVGKQDFWGIRP